MSKFILVLAMLSIATCQPSLPMNIIDCALSVRSVVEEAKIFVEKLNNNTPTNDLLYGYIILAGKVMGALRDCNINITINVIPATPEKCFEDIRGIYSNIRDAMEDEKSKNYNSLIIDVIALIQNTQQAIPDCTGKDFRLTNFNITQCAVDLESLYWNVETIYTDMKDGKLNYTLFINMTIDILSGIPGSLKDCGLPQYAEKFGNLPKSLNSKECRSGIADSITFIEESRKAYEEKNYVRLIHGLSGLYLQARIISSSCLNLELSFLLYRTLNLAQRLQSSEISKIEAKKEASVLLLKYQQFKVTKSFLSLEKELPSGCTEAVLALVPEAETIIKDIEEKDISAVISQLPTLVKLLSTLVAQCK